ncbi:MAG: hypothetical protein IPK12_19690 [Gemmatimonadetes bacterium]|nr:hypothetical protein [Gemmatimonadota bacterium]
MGASIISLLLLCVVPDAAPAQATLDARSGRYEVIGLHDWTLPQLLDSLAAHDASLTSQTCAVTLRQSLGFPDVSVVLYPAGHGGRPTKFFEIMVLEPGDSARSRLLPRPADSLPPSDRWADIALLLRQNNNLFGFLLTHPEALYSAEPVDSLLRRSPDTERMRLNLAAMDVEAAVEPALQAFLGDRNLANLMPALLVLGSPRSGPAGERALAQLLRHPFNFFAMGAADLLAYRLRTDGTPVNWAPLTPDIAAVLDGTNLFALDRVMELLRAVPPPTADGRRMVMGGGRMLLSRMAAADSITRTEAHALLMQLTGEQLPPDPARWATVLAVEWP